MSLKDRILVISLTGALVAAALTFSILASIFHREAESVSGRPEQAQTEQTAQNITEEKLSPPPDEAAGSAKTELRAREVPPENAVPEKVPAAASASEETAQAVTKAPAAKSAKVPAETSLPSVKSTAGTAAFSAKPPVKQVPAAAAVPNTRVPERAVKGKLVFVIDDAGNNLRELEPFLKFPGPLTIAVLPGLPYSAETAKRVRAAGKEAFLHQPMEPLGGSNPGPGAVYAGMTGDEIRAIINRNLDEIWPVSGINNHEGSRVTMDERSMEIILDICRERGIVFLDSRTTAETAAPGAARRMGLSIGERDVFLDNEQNRASMTAYLNTGLDKAERQGKAVMIGHAWSPELAPMLTEFYPELNERGFSFSTASELVRAGK